MDLYVNGVHFQVEVEGEGPTLLLLHGFTGSTDHLGAVPRLLDATLPGGAAGSDRPWGE